MGRYRCTSKHHGNPSGYCEECFQKQLLIDKLKTENAYLKAQLKYRKKKDQRPFSALFGSSTPSSKIEIKSSSLEENQKKKGGGKLGHRGTGRSLFGAQEADEVVSLKTDLESCPGCGGQLENKGIDPRCIVDAVLTEAYKVIYECQLKRCKDCSKEVSRRPLVLPKSKYGNGLISNAVVMHYLEGIPVKQVGKLFGVSHGALLHIFHKLADFWEPVVKQLTDDYRKASVKHADETGWRTDGKNGYAWLFCTPDLSLFKFGETREGRVPLDVLGPEPKGTLIVDRYGGYNKVNCPIQYCYAHLLRDLQDLEKDHPDHDEIKTFVGTLAPLFAEAMGLRRTASTDDAYYERASQIKTEMLAHCRAPSVHLAILTFQTLILENEHRLFHWVADRAIPPDNNRAERELRPTVIARKISFGSQSKRGANTRSVLMTILHTTAKRLEDQSIRQWFHSTLEALSRDSKTDLGSLIP